MTGTSATSSTAAPEPARMPGESAKAYGKLVEFCRLGPGRTFVEMSRRFGKSPSSYEKLTQRYGWHQRVEQYDLAIQQADAGRVRFNSGSEESSLSRVRRRGWPSPVG